MTSAKAPTVWTQEEVIKAMEANMLFHMTYFAKCTPSMHIIPMTDVTVVLSDIPDDTFNYVVASRLTTESAKSRIAEIKALFQDAKNPFAWWINENDTPADLDELLEADGFSLREINVGMYLPLHDYVVSKKETGLRFQQVDSKETLRDFSHIVVEVWVHKDSFALIYDAIPKECYVNSKIFQIYVGYLGKIPVVCGILVLHNDVAGIYYIATTPQHRKKGYATAMMELLLQNAKEQGYQMATLQASKEGKIVYEQMGFIPCSICKEYAITGVCHSTNNP